MISGSSVDMGSSFSIRSIRSFLITVLGLLSISSISGELFWDSERLRTLFTKSDLLIDSSSAILRNVF